MYFENPSNRSFFLAGMSRTLLSLPFLFLHAKSLPCAFGIKETGPVLGLSLGPPLPTYKGHHQTSPSPVSSERTSSSVQSTLIFTTCVLDDATLSKDPCCP